MDSAGLVAAVAAGAYAATNLDNLLIATGLLAHPGQSPGRFVAGVVASVVVILALCLGAALLAGSVPNRGLELLGLIPIGLGIRELLRLRAEPAEADARGSAPALSATAIAALMLGNSADSFAALAPLFAETRPGLLPAAALAVVVTAIAGSGIALRIARSERLGPLLAGVAPKLTPFVLIAVGVYVLTNTATDAVP